jgi:pyruvate/2-oxoglutarate dehydrogenase complex dihydrolipoamide dehydrogenase (E3) component
MPPGSRGVPEYGVVIGGDVGIDMQRVKARKDAIVSASRSGLTSALENAANITLSRGHARFASPQAVETAGERLRAGGSLSMSAAGRWCRQCPT